MHLLQLSLLNTNLLPSQHAPLPTHPNRNQCVHFLIDKYMWFQSGEFSVNVRKWCVGRESVHTWQLYNCSHFFLLRTGQTGCVSVYFFFNNENIAYYYWINICIFKKSAFVIVNVVYCSSTANIKARSAWLFDHCYDFSL